MRLSFRSVPKLRDGTYEIIGRGGVRYSVPTRIAGTRDKSLDAGASDYPFQRRSLERGRYQYRMFGIGTRSIITRPKACPQLDWGAVPHELMTKKDHHLLDHRDWDQFSSNFGSNLLGSIIGNIRSHK